MHDLACENIQYQTLLCILLNRHELTPLGPASYRKGSRAYPQNVHDGVENC